MRHMGRVWYESKKNTASIKFANRINLIRWLIDSKVSKKLLQNYMDQNKEKLYSLLCIFVHRTENVASCANTALKM